MHDQRVCLGKMRFHIKYVFSKDHSMSNIFSIDILSFNSVREYFGFPSMSIDELNADDFLKNSLKQLYTNGTEEILELLIGLALEPASNTVMGPTMNEIIYEQFDRTQRSDRYFTFLL